MKIKDILELDAGIEGITAEGQITKLFDPKEYDGPYGTFTTQFLVLEDDTGSIGAKVIGATLEPGCKGKVVKLEKIKLISYEKDGEEVKQLEVPKKVTIQFLDGSASTATSTTKSTVKSASVKQPIDHKVLFLEAIKEATELLTHPDAIEALKQCTEQGWRSDDVRSVVISRLIEKSRNR